MIRSNPCLVCPGSVLSLGTSDRRHGSINGHFGGRLLYNFATIWLKSELVLTNENLTVESKQSKGKGVIYCPLFVISAQCFDCESVEKHQSSGKQRE